MCSLRERGLDRSNAAGVALAAGVHFANAGAEDDVANIGCADSSAGENLEATADMLDERRKRAGSVTCGRGTARGQHARNAE